MLLKKNLVFTMEQIFARYDWSTANKVMLGYYPDTSPLEGWEKHGMHCPFEHCIRMTPLQPEVGPQSCPIFSHDCPAGKEQVTLCKEKEA